MYAQIALFHGELAEAQKILVKVLLHLFYPYF